MGATIGELEVIVNFVTNGAITAIKSWLFIKDNKELSGFDKKAAGAALGEIAAVSLGH